MRTRRAKCGAICNRCSRLEATSSPPHISPKASRLAQKQQLPYPQTSISAARFALSAFLNKDLNLTHSPVSVPYLHYATPHAPRPQSDRLLVGARKSDGTLVVFKWYLRAPLPDTMKAVPRRDVAEASILRRMVHPDWQDDPRNHCLRVLSWVADDDGPRGVFVTPLLRRWNDAPLGTVGEAVVMFAQLAEVRLVVFHAYRVCMEAE